MTPFAIETLYSIAESTRKEYQESLWNMHYGEQIAKSPSVSYLMNGQTCTFIIKPQLIHLIQRTEHSCDHYDDHLITNTVFSAGSGSLVYNIILAAPELRQMYVLAGSKGQGLASVWKSWRGGRPALGANVRLCVFWGFSGLGIMKELFFEAISFMCHSQKPIWVQRI